MMSFLRKLYWFDIMESASHWYKTAVVIAISQANTFTVRQTLVQLLSMSPHVLHD